MTPPEDSAGSARRQPAPAAGQKVDAEAVKAFLALHPETLHDAPDVLAKIVPAERRSDAGGGILDFQLFTIERLRQEIEDLRELQQAMVTAAEENAVARDRVFDAVLRIMEARNFEHLVHYITTDLAGDIEVDLVALGVEATDATAGLAGLRSPVGAAGGPSVMVLEAGTVDALLGVQADGRSRDFVLREDAEGADALFGIHAAQIESEALIRLTFSRAAPPGILALGSTRANQFYPEQAVDHLAFLARVIERGIRLWLDLPRA